MNTILHILPSSAPPAAWPPPPPPPQHDFMTRSLFNVRHSVAFTANLERLEMCWSRLLDLLVLEHLGNGYRTNKKNPFVLELAILFPTMLTQLPRAKLRFEMIWVLSAPCNSPTYKEVGKARRLPSTSSAMGNCSGVHDALSERMITVDTEQAKGTFRCMVNDIN